MRNYRLRGCCILAAAFLFLFSGRASAETPIVLPVKKSITVDAGLSQTEALRASPSSAALGVDCGMADMCGIDPCTCGSPDAWGHCACNGTKKTPVSYLITVSNPSVARVSVANGTLIVKGLSAGHTDVRVTARLKHYADAVQTVRVTVQPPYYLFWLIPGVVVAAAAAFFFLRLQKKRKMKN
ncbi:Ig-like domain-containing protein [Ethanoligenens harbinense]|uniref:Ig domain protein group 2 domain protein n=1 Tax=Ethanoligenens harbinense (strain DSM 18485 / JCM 12961 / CGMCC 1.5033 / YUAN-3) TaxID=663278 RepID=E6U442_ETHHY|nr:Ig domain-containing protein [Ethanoligenens harbinense]ADU26542.1 Ig domain protein group 2 domain protein [Ethanoligenens harbinense YUAN-3]AVQ95668.1 hypothetical protein CXQ68_05125 [Ethanoligenens harbinense YUAN-3]AYF38331.1 hypothetical protein CXP51_04985 [Ethanoligenens harbinense]AYF41076.1 hypothetical protein CN246_05115 [Ethanoligenens harbinense]QCN91907.1 hypothetical protein DRA42_05140 [Ethanoligenens harbinense]